MDIRILQSSDGAVLDSVLPGVFDLPIDAEQRESFLRDPNHILAVCLDSGLVVGMASGLVYYHPDKPPQLWINEVGVALAYRRKGIAAAMLKALFATGRERNCTEAWVLTESDNGPATSLYRSLAGRPKEQVMFSFELPYKAE